MCECKDKSCCKHAEIKLRGPRGYTGPKGVQGIIGPEGQQGPAGPAGPSGASGCFNVKINKLLGNSLTAVSTGGTAPYSYAWEFADNGLMFNFIGPTTNQIVNVTPTNSRAFDSANLFNAGKASLVKVTATDSTGCQTKDTYLIINYISEQ